MYYCWHCGEDGGIKFNDENLNQMRRKSVESEKVVNINQSFTNNLNEIEENNGSLQYLSSRGISKETATKAGVKFTNHYIGAIKKRLLV